MKVKFFLNDQHVCLKFPLSAYFYTLSAMLNMYKLITIIDISSMAESVKVINGMGRYGGAGDHHRPRSVGAGQMNSL